MTTPTHTVLGTQQIPCSWKEIPHSGTFQELWDPELPLEPVRAAILHITSTIAINVLR